MKLYRGRPAACLNVRMCYLPSCGLLAACTAWAFRPHTLCVVPVVYTLAHIVCIVNTFFQKIRKKVSFLLYREKALPEALKHAEKIH